MKKRLEFLATGFGSLCCIVPLILAGIGLGGTMLPMFFVRYKVPFMTAAFAALGLAWLLYARDRRRCAAEGCALAGSKTRLWVLGGNTAVLVVFALLSLTPVGVMAGNAFFPPPDLEAMTTARLARSPATTEGGGAEGQPLIPPLPLESEAGDGAISKAGGAMALQTGAQTGGGALIKVALRVEGMT
ncbi:MAG: hypothetical protein ACE5IM_15080 [Nitrospinota bacterium]